MEEGIVMEYDNLAIGVIGTVLGALVGAWISCRLTYGFQKRLLQQQLEFQKAQSETDALARAKIHAEILATFTEFRNMMNTRMSRLPSAITSEMKGRTNNS